MSENDDAQDGVEAATQLYNAFGVEVPGDEEKLFPVSLCIGGDPRLLLLHADGRIEGLTAKELSEISAKIPKPRFRRPGPDGTVIWLILKELQRQEAAEIVKPHEGDKP